MTLSYLALALATVLFLAGIAGTIFTIRTIAQRRAEHPGNIKMQTWHRINSPAPVFEHSYLMIEFAGRDAGFSRLRYLVAYYLALGIAAIEKMAVSIIHYFK